jgi:hypothetical protein
VAWVPDGVAALVVSAAGFCVGADAQPLSISVSDVSTTQATSAGEWQRTMPR